MLENQLNHNLSEKGNFPPELRVQEDGLGLDPGAQTLLSRIGL